MGDAPVEPTSRPRKPRARSSNTVLSKQNNTSVSKDSRKNGSRSSSPSTGTTRDDSGILRFKRAGTADEPHPSSRFDASPIKRPGALTPRAAAASASASAARGHPGGGGGGAMSSLSSSSTPELRGSLDEEPPPPPPPTPPAPLLAPASASATATATAAGSPLDGPRAPSFLRRGSGVGGGAGRGTSASSVEEGPATPPLVHRTNGGGSGGKRSTDAAKGAEGASWRRYYSGRRELWFMYNHRSGEVFWEAQRVGDRWEKFLTPDGEPFFLNSLTGEVTTTNPTLAAANTAAAFGGARASLASVSTATGGGKGGAPPVAVPPAASAYSQRGSSSSSSNGSGGGATGSEISTLKAAAQQRKSISDAIQQHSDNIKKAMLAEEEAAPKYRLMANPHNPRRICWDFFVVIPLLVYLAVVLPMRMCFALEPDPNSRLFYWELAIDMIFIADILLNFRTGYLDDNDEVIMHPKKVALAYLKSWFWLDAVSGIPFGLLDITGGVGAIAALKALKSSRVLKTLRILRFLKLTRLLKGTKFINRLDRDTLDVIEDFLAEPTFRAAMRLLRITFMITYTTHIMACFWVLVGRLGDMERERFEETGKWGGSTYTWRDDPPSWLAEEGYTFRDTAEKALARSIYLCSYYFCLTTMTSVGFGDIYARNDKERAFVIVLEGVGGFVYAMVIASLTSVVTKMDSNRRIVSERLDSVSSYVKNRRFPRTLGRRVRRYFRHFYSKKTGIDEHVILADLSTALRLEVSSFLMSDIMGAVPMFKAVGPSTWSQILPLLRPARFERNEVVCRQNEPSLEMFLVVEGYLTGETFVPHDLLDLHNIDLLGPGGGPGRSARVSYDKAPGAGGAGTAAKAAVAFAVEPESKEEGGGGGGGGCGRDDDDDEEEGEEAPNRRFNSRGGGGGGGLATSFNSGGSSGGRSSAAARMFKGILQGAGLDGSPLGSGGGAAGDEAGRIVPVENGVSVRRIIREHDTINCLSVVKVWSQSVETVVAEDPVQCYGIHADAFAKIFFESSEGEEALSDMRHRAAACLFEMVHDPAAPTEHGAPLFLLSAAEVAERERSYDLNLAQQRSLQLEVDRAYTRAKSLSRPPVVRSRSGSTHSQGAIMPPPPTGGGGGGGGGASRRRSRQQTEI